MWQTFSRATAKNERGAELSSDPGVGRVEFNGPDAAFDRRFMMAGIHEANSKDGMRLGIAGVQIDCKPRMFDSPRYPNLSFLLRKYPSSNDVTNCQTRMNRGPARI